jgi:hypothetical protein
MPGINAVAIGVPRDLPVESNRPAIVSDPLRRKKKAGRVHGPAQ